MSQSCIQPLLPMANPAESRVLPSWVLPQLEATLQNSSRSMDSPGIPCCPLIAWFRGTPKTADPPQRHNAAQLHPTSNGCTCLPGSSRARQAVSLSLCLCQALPRRLALHILVPHSFLSAKTDPDPHVWWLFLLSSLPQREEKSLLRTTAGRTDPVHFLQSNINHPPHQPVPGPSLFPSSQSLHHTPFSQGCRFPPSWLTQPVSCL